MPNITQFTNFLRGAQSFLGGSGSSAAGEATKAVQLRRLLQEPSPREEFALSKRRQGVSEANLALRAGEHQLNQVRVLFSGLEQGLQNAASPTEVEHFYHKAGAIRKTLSPVMQQLYDIKFPGGRFGPIGRREQVFDSMFSPIAITTTAEEDANLFGTQTLRQRAQAVQKNNFVYGANIPEPKSIMFPVKGIWHTTYKDAAGMTQTIAVSDEEFERLGITKANPWKATSQWTINDGANITRYETRVNPLTNESESQVILQQRISRIPGAREKPTGKPSQANPVYASILANITLGKAKIGAKDKDSRIALLSKRLIKFLDKGKRPEAQSLLRSQFPEYNIWVKDASKVDPLDYRDYILNEDQDTLIISARGTVTKVLVEGLLFPVYYDSTTGDMFVYKDKKRQPGEYLGNTETTGARVIR